MKPKLALFPLLLAASALIVITASANGIILDLGWWSVDGGGQTSGGGSYGLAGTIGQPDAGSSMNGCNYSVTGGFLAGVPMPPDAVTISGNTGVPGAQLLFMKAGPVRAYADGSGNYSFTVPAGWSGSVTPFKANHHFTPPSTNYVSLGGDQTAQNYTATYTPFTEFDADSKTDPAKFIPGTGYVWWFKSSTSTWDGRDVGTDTTTYVRRSDFDGDGLTDPAKYISGAQALWYWGSADTSWHGVYIGSNSYLLPGSDFDGDGKTDPAKYTVDGSIWRLPSGGGGWVGTFIGTDAAPVMAGSDYDGDGITDLAKYVPAAGAIWYYGSSDCNWHGVYIGSDGTPVPASDFDGDGITDMAKYLGTNNLWYRRSSDNVWVGVYLGPGSFTYVPGGDFDGDGKTDPAKFDTVGKGLWWLKSTTSLWASKYMGGEVYEIVN